MRQINLPDNAWTEYKLVNLGEGITTAGVYSDYTSANAAGLRWMERCPKVRCVIHRETSWTEFGQLRKLTEALVVR
jgi:hypothetical protein